jgi:hypothetical protein
MLNDQRVNMTEDGISGSSFFGGISQHPPMRDHVDMMGYDMGI